MFFPWLLPSFFFSSAAGGSDREDSFFFPCGGPLGGFGLFPLSLPRSFLVPIGGGTDPRAAVVLPFGVSLAERSVMLRFNPMCVHQMEGLVATLRWGVRFSAGQASYGRGD